MNFTISCPLCDWNPSKEDEWECEGCGYWFSYFSQSECPQCGTEVQRVHCKEHNGGCGQVSPYLDWFCGMDDALRELNIEKTD